MTFRPYPFQVEGVDRMDDLDGRALLADQMGLGKAQPLDSRVLTPTGWVPMGNLKVGDAVIGGDGLPTKVIGVFPQGTKEVFRLRFRDGSAAECCDDHLWLVNTPSRKMLGKAPRVLPLSEIRKRLYNGAGNCVHYIPTVQPVEFPTQAMPVDPYLMGYILANGCLTQNRVNITIPDEETVHRISPILPTGTVLRQVSGSTIDFTVVKKERYRASDPNPLLDILRQLDLMRKGADQKSIPRCYLYNSVENRRALLQGMMDGDGCTYNNVLEYGSTSKALARQFRELVWSLGGTCTLSMRFPKFIYKGEKKTGKKYYRHVLALPNTTTPFRLSRKAEAHKPRTKYHPTRALVAVESEGQRPCQCIRVEASHHTYVTDDYVVTHNTAQALMWAARNRDARPVIVVCPASIKYQWAREAARHFQLVAEVLETGKVPQNFLVQSATNLIVVNYDILRKWLPILKSIRPRLVITDECHYLKNPRAARSKAFAKLCQGVPHVIALSGTPLTNRPAELFNILHILRPDLYPAEWPFLQRYSNPRMTIYGWNFSGAANLQELHQQLSKHLMIRRRLEDVIQQLPAQERQVVVLPLSDQKQYQHALSDFVGWARAQGRNTLKIQKSVALARTTLLKHLIARLKLPAVLQWLESYLDDSEEKIILYGIHHDIVEPIHAHFRRNSVLITGSTRPKDRQLAFDQFNRDRRTRLFVGNLQAAGVGWSASSCSTVAFCELGWVPAEHLQAEKRVQGIGRGVAGQKSRAIYLAAKGTVEEQLAGVLQRKQAVLDETLDGTADGDKSTLDVFDLFMEQLFEEERLVTR